MKNANTHPFIAAVQSIIFMILIKSKQIRTYFIMAGLIIRHIDLMQKTFRNPRFFVTREILWKKMFYALDAEKFKGVEFGVAWGYLTNFWLSRYEEKIESWDGYDRFLGLPEDFMSHKVGAFSNSGNPPKITSSKVSWHIGDIETTLGHQSRIDDDPATVYFFDLDLFDPSLHAWNQIVESLKAGDILYLDEAFANDEWTLLTKHMLKAASFECIGFTLTSVALKFKSRKISSYGNQ